MSSNIAALEAAARERESQCKLAAVYYKRKNEKTQALEYLRRAKTCHDILEHIEMVKEGVIEWADIAAEVPELPAAPPPLLLDELMSAPPNTGSPTSPTAPSTATPTIAVPALIEKLKEQAALAKTASIYYLSKQKKAEALKFGRLMKRLNQDAESLAGLPAGAPAPPLEFEEVAFEQENRCADLSANEYEVVIVRASQLPFFKAGYAAGASIPVVVTWDVGYPDGTGKGETPATSTTTSDVTFDRSFKIAIDRTNRGLQRHMERRKATFEVYYQTGGLLGLGFLSSRGLLGRGIVKLDGLLTKAELVETINLVDDKRRPTGATLQVKLRMQTPLVRSDVIIRKERWTLLAAGSAAPSAPTSPAVSVLAPTPISPAASPASAPIRPPSPAKASPPPPRPASPARPANNPAPTPSAPAPAKPAAPSPAPPAASDAVADDSAASAVSAELQATLAWLESTDHLVSCLVLEHEIKAASAAPSSDESQSRAFFCQTKLNMLQVQVSVGALTMPAYAAQLRAAIAEAKRHALALKRGNMVQDAVRVLRWVKLMEQEVGEIEQMLAEGGDGEEGMDE
ncbi:hypothetical protein H9P43_001118 [Blastocladiella emersonii ATCC 22665]|nr:hypothetical protein H9P43_001118 [Blastocladiella emersonii ATCC 22665]